MNATLIGVIASLIMSRQTPVWPPGISEPRSPGIVGVASDRTAIAARNLKVFLKPSLVNRGEHDRDRLYSAYLNDVDPEEVLAPITQTTATSETLWCAFWALVAMGDSKAGDRVTAVLRPLHSTIDADGWSGHSRGDVEAIIAASRGDVETTSSIGKRMTGADSFNHRTNALQYIALAFIMRNDYSSARIRLAKIGAAQDRIAPWSWAYMLKRDALGLDGCRKLMSELGRELPDTHFVDGVGIVIEDFRYGGNGGYDLTIPKWIGLEAARLGMYKLAAIAGNKLAQMADQGQFPIDSLNASSELAKAYGGFDKAMPYVEAAAISLDPALIAKANDRWGSARQLFENWSHGGQNQNRFCQEMIFYGYYWGAYRAYRTGDRQAFRAMISGLTQNLYVDSVDSKGKAMAGILAEAGGELQAAQVLMRKMQNGLTWYRKIPGPGEAPKDGMVQLRFWRQWIPSPTPWDAERETVARAAAPAKALGLVSGKTVKAVTVANHAYSAYLGTGKTRPDEGILYLPAGGNAAPPFKVESDRYGWMSIGLENGIWDQSALADEALDVIADIEIRLKRKVKWRLIGFSAGGFASSVVADALGDRCLGIITLGSFYTGTNPDHPFPVVELCGDQDGNGAEARRQLDRHKDDTWPIELVGFPGGHEPGSNAQRSAALAKLLQIRRRH